jgi:hypothetical protein
MEAAPESSRLASSVATNGRESKEERSAPSLKGSKSEKLEERWLTDSLSVERKLAPLPLFVASGGGEKKDRLKECFLFGVLGNVLLSGLSLLAERTWR